MLERERKETILRLLDLHSFANIHDVVEATGSSEATIRRVFIEMEKEGLLRRVRGGVELVKERETSGFKEPSLNSRVSVNHEKKRRIARKAASLIQSGDTIFIDGGSTTFHLTEFISTLSITVVTNSFAIAEHLVRHSNCTVIVPEGSVNTNSLLILNHLSADPFENYHASIAFMGIEGITENALTNSEPLVIQAERAMIAHSQRLIVLADASKFGKIGSLMLCPVEKVQSIITTQDADPLITEKLKDKGVEIIQV
ncbi:DeoR/GlpR family DNA-binding transcription regulator [Treponema sp.]